MHQRPVWPSLTGGFQRRNTEYHLEWLAEYNHAVERGNIGVIWDRVVLIAHIPFELGQFQVTRTCNLARLFRVLSTGENDPKVGAVGYIEVL